jgi:hypothetical protein
MDKQRIIYVTGMKPKPDPEAHRPVLMRVLANALARSGEGAAEWLKAREENFVLVSWTSLLYAERTDIAVDLPGVERLLEQPMPTDRDRREAAGLRRRLLRIWHLVGDSYPWLSRIVASSALQVTLADVRRYLSNSEGVADAIRQSLIDQLLEAWNAGERVLVIAQSRFRCCLRQLLAAVPRGAPPGTGRPVPDAGQSAGDEIHSQGTQGRGASRCPALSGQYPTVGQRLGAWRDGLSAPASQAVLYRDGARRSG